jgi:hypothetical protein
MSDSFLERLTSALRPVGGLVALVLGGSRARGTAGPSSDDDLGLYYGPSAPLDTAQFQEAVRPTARRPGSGDGDRARRMGPWINGGAWLAVSGRKPYRA